MSAWRGLWKRIATGQLLSLRPDFTDVSREEIERAADTALADAWADVGLALRDGMTATTPGTSRKRPARSTPHR
jgi:hypothetical protein